ncbi:MAG: diguanylate cyclase [Chloroflexi bacterium]|nr:MAG: diguanylate cyclase [Chloroflexota bacterium]MBL1196584.1 diguanylate cyclase [Chloroflexota bacterium]NOH13879.1 diguanylate cyclase [Chloroflexota bacterium]
MNILIMDDDAQHRGQLREQLGEHTIHEAATPLEALNQLMEDSNRIVLARFKTAQYDGFDLVNALLAANLKLNPYVLWLVNKRQQPEAAFCLGPIPGDILVEPVAPPILEAALTEAEKTLEIQHRRTKEFVGTTQAYAVLASLGILPQTRMYKQAVAELERNQREGSPVSLVLLEISNYDALLAQLGEREMGQALAIAGSTMRANVRSYDLIGHWVANRYLIVLPGASLEQATAIGQRVQQSVQAFTMSPEGGRIKMLTGVTRAKAGEKIPLYQLVEQASQSLTLAA